jgi:tetratricopeptide (TPR) repeat protein
MSRVASLGLAVVLGGLFAPSARADRSAADTAVAKAKQDLAAGSLDAAAADGQAAVTADPTDTDAYDLLADVYARTARFDDELTTFGQAVTQVPGYANGWFHLAYALRKEGRLEEAAACYYKAATLAPTEPDPWFGLALTYKALGNRDATLQAYERYVVLENRPAEAAWVEKAKQEMQALVADGAKGTSDQGQSPPTMPIAAATTPPAAGGATATASPTPTATPTPAATPTPTATPTPAAAPTPTTSPPPVASASPPAVVTAAAEPAESDSARAARLKGEGDAALAKGLFPVAVKDYKDALTANPNFADAHVGLAQTYLKQSRYPAAETEANAAIGIDPVYASAWTVLGAASLGAGDNVGALKAYFRATNLMPKDPDSWLGLARAENGTGDPKSAVESYQKYLSLETRAGHDADQAEAKTAIAKAGGTAASPAVAVATTPGPSAVPSPAPGPSAVPSPAPGPSSSLPTQVAQNPPPASVPSAAPGVGTAPVMTASSSPANTPVAPPSPVAAPAPPVVQTPQAELAQGDARFAAGQYNDAAADYRVAAAWDPTRMEFPADRTLVIEALYREGVSYAVGGDLWSAIGCWERELEIDPNDGAARDALTRAKAKVGSQPLGGSSATPAPPATSQPATPSAPTPIEQATTDLQQGDAVSAQAVLDPYLAQSPNDAPALVLHGSARAVLMDDQGALGDLLHAIALDPQPAAPYRGAAEAYARLGEHDPAVYYVGLYERAAQGDPQESLVAKTEPDHVSALLAQAPPPSESPTNGLVAPAGMSGPTASGVSSSLPASTTRSNGLLAPTLGSTKPTPPPSLQPKVDALKRLDWDPSPPTDAQPDAKTDAKVPPAAPAAPKPSTKPANDGLKRLDLDPSPPH